MRTLRDNARPPADPPLQRDLGGLAGALPRDVAEDGMAQQRGGVVRARGPVRGVGVAEGGVGGRVDGVGGVVEEPGGLGEVGVQFHLVGGGGDGGGAQEARELPGGEVADSELVGLVKVPVWAEAADNTRRMGAARRQTSTRGRTVWEAAAGYMGI